MDTPALVVQPQQLIPVSTHLSAMAEIPPSRMFLIKKSLSAYRAKQPDSLIFDASQGDGGASLPGVPLHILQRAAELQQAHGTAYDMPYGTDTYRKAVAEKYWQMDESLGFGAPNIMATVGGRDALEKAYRAMLTLGYGRQGDFILTTRVPWISYNWGPYGIGANVLLAPGDAAHGWALTPESIRASVAFARSLGREIAGMLITSPDNPTGNTLSLETQADLGRAALDAGIPFVLYDWMYHYVTDEQPADLNAFLRLFTPQQRQHLMFLDGLTKSLGASNIRNCHLIAAKNVIDFCVARASHGVIPDFYSQAVAIAAYEIGYPRAIEGIVTPTNASRVLLRNFAAQHPRLKTILGQGYYAFFDTSDFLAAHGWQDTEPLGQYLAEDYGLAVVPGVYFSTFGSTWIRFSYATPPERTQGALARLAQALF